MTEALFDLRRGFIDRPSTFAGQFRYRLTAAAPASGLAELKLEPAIVRLKDVVPERNPKTTVGQSVSK